MEIEVKTCDVSRLVFVRHGIILTSCRGICPPEAARCINIANAIVSVRHKCKATQDYCSEQISACKQDKRSGFEGKWTPSELSVLALQQWFCRRDSNFSHLCLSECCLILQSKIWFPGPL